MITLKPVTKDNWLSCIKLELNEEQRPWVASNLFSIAESSFYPNHKLRCVCSDEDVVGFAAYRREDQDDVTQLYWIFRLMIDKRYQGGGVGTRAVQLLLEEMRHLGARQVRTMFRAGNAVAGNLYRKVGFVESGQDADGDTLLAIRL